LLQGVRWTSCSGFHTLSFTRRTGPVLAILSPLDGTLEPPGIEGRRSHWDSRTVWPERSHGHTLHRGRNSRTPCNPGRGRSPGVQSALALLTPSGARGSLLAVLDRVAQPAKLLRESRSRIRPPWSSRTNRARSSSSHWRGRSKSSGEIMSHASRRLSREEQAPAPS